jgi:hypothetical protein
MLLLTKLWQAHYFVITCFAVPDDPAFLTPQRESGTSTGRYGELGRSASYGEVFVLFFEELRLKGWTFWQGPPLHRPAP